MSNLLFLRDSCHWLDALHRCPIPAQHFFCPFFFFERRFQSTGRMEGTMAATLMEKERQWNERSILERRRNEFFVGGFCEIICLRLLTTPLSGVEVGVTRHSRCSECCSTALFLLLLLLLCLESVCRFRLLHSPGSNARAALPGRPQPGEPSKTRRLSWQWRSAQNQPK